MVPPGKTLKRIVIRTDASEVMGSGHVMRCLTLAHALRERGCEVVFVSREHAGHMCEILERQDFRVARIPVREGEHGSEGTYSSWLGGGWQEDADATLAAAATISGAIDWLVVDHYGVNRLWEQAVRPATGRVMVIDDLADREHDCDLLLDQNLVADFALRYRGLLPAACVQLLGPEYALLQPIYEQLRDGTPPRGGPVRRILIYFGGADHQQLTSRALAALLEIGRDDFEVDVVCRFGEQSERMRRMIVDASRYRIHEPQATLAHLIAQADLAIGGAGATSWERLCLGLPSLVIVVAENQRPIARSLAERRLAVWLGDAASATREAIDSAARAVLSTGIETEWSQRCRAVIDGRGARRVCATMLLDRDTRLSARRAEPDDERLLLNWANDPVARQNSFESGQIDAQTHHSWFTSRLHEKQSTLLLIIETSEHVPVGQARFELHDGVWRTGYSLASQFRGRGCGRALLQAALEELRAQHPGAEVSGLVKPQNKPSHEVFKALGFAAQARDSVVEYRRQL